MFRPLYSADKVLLACIGDRAVPTVWLDAFGEREIERRLLYYSTFSRVAIPTKLSLLPLKYCVCLYVVPVIICRLKDLPVYMNRGTSKSVLEVFEVLV